MLCLYYLFFLFRDFVTEYFIFHRLMSGLINREYSDAETHLKWIFSIEFLRKSRNFSENVTAE